MIARNDSVLSSCRGSTIQQKTAKGTVTLSAPTRELAIDSTATAFVFLGTKARPVIVNPVLATVLDTERANT